MNNLTFEQLSKAISQLFDKLNSIEKILLNQGSNSQPETNELLNIKQVGEFLSLSVHSIRDFLSRKFKLSDSSFLKGKRKNTRKKRKKSKHNKIRRVPKPGKFIRWLIQVFFILVLHAVVNSHYPSGTEYAELKQHLARECSVAKRVAFPRLTAMQR